MRVQLILPAPIAGDDGKLATGRQGREGRDFLSPLEQPFYCNFHIHERRPRAYARVDKNNGDVFSRPSRPSRPTRPGDAVADLRSASRVIAGPNGWHQAVADATAFTSQWGAQAQTFGWTARELFGLHPVPEQPAANYSRLSRLDTTGLIWLLRGRPVIALTAAEAVMRCQSGATLTYRRQNEPVAKAAEIAKRTL
jgi:hypothetical protein